jgi:hypothetical protein
LTQSGHLVANFLATPTPAISGELVEAYSVSGLIDALQALTTGIADSVHWRQLPSPRPATFDLELQRPTEEGTHDNQSSEKAKASESKLDRYSFYYIGSNQDFEAEQQRSTDAYFILIVVPLYISFMGKEQSRPDNTSNYNEDAEKFDAYPNQVDQVAYGWFKGIFHFRCSFFGQRLNY